MSLVSSMLSNPLTRKKLEKELQPYLPQLEREIKVLIQKELIVMAVDPDTDIHTMSGRRKVSDKLSAAMVDKLEDTILKTISKVS